MQNSTSIKYLYKGVIVDFDFFYRDFRLVEHLGDDDHRVGKYTLFMGYFQYFTNKKGKYLDCALCFGDTYSVYIGFHVF